METGTGLAILQLPRFRCHGYNMADLVRICLNTLNVDPNVIKSGFSIIEVFYPCITSDIHNIKGKQIQLGVSHIKVRVHPGNSLLDQHANTTISRENLDRGARKSATNGRQQGGISVDITR